LELYKDLRSLVEMLDHKQSPLFGDTICQRSPAAR
jgi:hypothetical protein